jgi:hypothetical protein
MRVNVQASGGGSVWESEEVEGRLRDALYRFECPGAQTLGEFVLDLFDTDERSRVAAHVGDCADCHGELNILREFLEV